ncbi:hypothetical protein LTR27_010509 [Elasticomyces elasticus]|nr:hypothetical protein LTR27_010509 [Elasticomyces elasticus]
MASTTDASNDTAPANEGEVCDTFNEWSSGLLTLSDQMPRCRLLELPEELQLEIYELVVTSEKKLRLNRICCPGYGADVNDIHYGTLEIQEQRERHQPAITKTCRSIRSIALPAYYNRNFFEVCCCIDKPWGVPYGIRAVTPWLKKIGASDRVLLGNFNIHERVWPNNERVWPNNARSAVQPFGATARAFHLRLPSAPGYILRVRRRRMTKSAGCADEDVEEVIV